MFLTNYNNNVALKKTWESFNSAVRTIELNSGEIGLLSYYTENYRK